MPASLFWCWKLVSTHEPSRLVCVDVACGGRVSVRCHRMCVGKCVRMSAHAYVLEYVWVAVRHCRAARACVRVCTVAQRIVPERTPSFFGKATLCVQQRAVNVPVNVFRREVTNSTCVFPLPLQYEGHCDRTVGGQCRNCFCRPLLLHLVVRNDSYFHPIPLQQWWPRCLLPATGVFRR